MNVTKNENNATLILSLIGSAGFILLFGLIIWLTYIPTRPGKVDAATRSLQEQKLIELKAKATQTLNSYAVVSKPDGIYRIPIERAMELTVESYQK